MAERDPVAVYASVAGDLPRITYIEAQGGLNCEWSNGVGHASSSISSSDYRGVQVSILPDADAQWAKYQTYSGGEARYCNSPENLHCGIEAFVNGYWVSADLTGVVAAVTPGEGEAAAEANAYFDSLMGAVGALAAPGPAWTPPASTVALPADCEGFISAAEVASLLGVDEELFVEHGHGGWSIWAGARAESGGDQCSWSSTDSYSAGSIAWLPAGAWAAEQVLPLSAFPEPPATVEIDGLAATDTASLRCGDDFCIVDLVIGGNWVQIWGFGAGERAVSPLDSRTTAITLATAVAAGIRS